MNRRDFITRLEGVALAVPSVLSLVACGEAGGGDAGAAVTYVFSKDSGHTHSVRLNAVQLAKLASGESVTLETRSLHLHTWVLSPGSACG
jgi:hypothetical protein